MSSLSNYHVRGILKIPTWPVLPARFWTNCAKKLTAPSKQNTVRA